MEIANDKTEIIIYPDKYFAARIIWEEFGVKGNRFYHYSIYEQLGSIFFNKDTLPEEIDSFKFSGFGDKKFQSYDDLEGFISRLKSITPNNLPLDTLLFIFMLYDGIESVIEVNKGVAKYLDELIDVFILISKRQITLKSDYSKQSFDLLTKEDKEFIIINHANTVGRMVMVKQDDNEKHKKAILHYFSNEFDFIIKGRKHNGGEVIQTGNNTGEFVLPSTLSNKLLQNVLEEVFNEHKRHDTKFYNMLCSGQINLFELENRTTYKNYNYSNRMLYNLITVLKDYLKGVKAFNLTKDMNVCIYDLLVFLSLLNPKRTLDKNDKNDAIKTILKDNNPQNDHKRGKLQLYR
jgi:hypothetical protein